MRSFISLVYLLWALFPCPTAAQPGNELGLSWVREVGAEACPDAAALARAIEDEFGPTFSAPGDAPRAIEGWVRPGPGGGFDATVRLWKTETLQGIRQLHVAGDDCRALERPLLVVIALLLDPERSWVGQFPGLFADAPEDPAAILRDQPLAETAVVPEPETPEAAAPVSPPGAPAQQTFLSLDGGLGWGVTGGLDGFVQLSALHEWVHAALRLSALAWPRTELAGEAGTVLRMGTGMAMLQACPRSWEQGRLRLSVCLGGAAGLSRLRGQGFASEGQSWEGLAGVSASAHATLRLAPRWHVGMNASSLVYVARVRALYTASDGTVTTLYEQPVGALWGGVGLTLSF